MGQDDTCLTEVIRQNLLVRVGQICLLGRCDVEDTLLSSFLFGTDRTQALHVICYDAVDGSESIDDDLFLLLLPLFVVALNGTLDSFRGRGVICEDFFDGLRLDFFLCHDFLVFSYVDICFFFDIVDKNVNRNVCELKRIFYIL